MTIEKITRAKGIIYRAVWVNPITGRRKTARDDPQAFAGPPPSTTFSSIALRYLREADLSESTKDVELYNLDIAINPVIGAKDAASLTKADAREIERLCRERGNKQNTIKRKIALVKAILSWAVEHEIIDAHPLRDYKCKQGQEFDPPHLHHYFGQLEKHSSCLFFCGLSMWVMANQIIEEKPRSPPQPPQYSAQP